MAEHDERHAKRQEYMRNYLREYRKRNPDKVKQWRQSYILRAADRLREAEANQSGGGDRGGN